ncbi:serine/threonine protein kinase [Micromonospora viridifaciens]|uniref:non-specific serine/threonine protein kinase n=1 Tax=Micromonospora viridifaciens TaxID=1881 RepID=A0A1C4WEW6_MICVI|nr:serine/threonine-protein kinase [Micromonospora viridifaciens]SCE94722.1 serine/threonine protein kinase [Micromonospora viridifaciens]
MLGRLLDGRYQCEELLGSGGMGEVWRGRDLRLDRPVAIKVLAAAALMEPMAAERFDREARAAAGLTHPHIVAVYDFGTEENDSYLIMELVEGRTVSALIADGPLTVLQALSIAVQTCDGIAAAHAAGVVHRDVKPGNLIVAATGTVKICDFGIARLPLAEGEKTLTEPATKLGSSSYMSPEQALGQPVDHRTDLYGLGCTLYAMLAGGPPFAGEPLGVLHQHVNAPPQPLRERRPDVPAELDALAAELLAKDPADRPSGAAEVRDRLAALLPRAGTPFPLVPVTPADPGRPGRSRPVIAPSPRPGRPLARYGRVALLAAALLGVALLALTGVTQLDRDDRTPMAGPATPPASATTAVAPRVPAVPLSVAPATPTLRAVASATRSPASPTPSPRATSRRPSPTAPADPIAGMRQSIREQVEAGRLNPDAAKDLHTKVDAIAKAIAENDTDQAEKQLKKLRDKLGELRRDGKLTTDGYDALTADADRIAADLR